ncbi:hypothetical protein cyc_04054 [Cyclospora cayetanensis]|uniref:Uncharacterized protein n=1 Tax=Cyclospora cayetanensis TaxID=88456 RepID=A0A1D3D570_9EIME|nr:hypothetical protein cyc_04054 [Cyclospora cayetanensis]
MLMGPFWEFYIPENYGGRKDVQALSYLINWLKMYLALQPPDKKTSAVQVLWFTPSVRSGGHRMGKDSANKQPTDEASTNEYYLRVQDRMRATPASMGGKEEPS